MEKVLVKAPAKLNLTLDIVSRLDNGYHEMDMLMQSVDLYEQVIIKKADTITIKCVCPDGKNLPDIPLDDTNTAYKSVQLFFEAAGIQGGADVTIIKSVPVQAGMGGGSADSAGVLVGLNVLYDKPFSREQLCEIGNKVGADVPFAIMGGTLRATGIGESFEKIPALQDCFFVVAMPKLGVSTKTGFEQYDKYGSDNRPDTDMLVGHLENGDFDAFCRGQINVMQESCGTDDTKQICDIFLNNGAKSALMTGSGSAVYGIFTSVQKHDDILTEISDLTQSSYVLKPTTQGAFVEKIYK